MSFENLFWSEAAVLREQRRPNPRLQRPPLRAPLSRKPLGRLTLERG